MAAIVVTAVICAGLLYLYTTRTFNEITAIRQASDTQSAEMDRIIIEIKARKAEELRLKQLADAKKTADDSITLTAAEAADVDATTCNTAKTHTDPTAIDVLVNKKHCIQPLTFVPGGLVDVGGGFLLQQGAAAQYLLLKAAAENAGVAINLTSSYRSYSNQVSTYAYWVGVSGAAGADTYSARPGYSEHQTGWAFDIASNGCALDCFGTSAAYQWVASNAATYGFIQRYIAGYEAITGYSAEEWHYRYVGTDVALDMQAQNIKTLEQYWGMAGGPYY
jgi:D-alanyl-D-alanine carboxypeptidase